MMYVHFRKVNFNSFKITCYQNLKSIMNYVSLISNVALANNYDMFMGENLMKFLSKELALCTHSSISQKVFFKKYNIILLCTSYPPKLLSIDSFLVA